MSRTKRNGDLGDLVKGALAGAGALYGLLRNRVAGADLGAGLVFGTAF